MEETIRGILLDFTETMDDGSNCIEIHKYDNLVNELNKAFSLNGVSQQREQLIAFSECVVKDVTRKGHEEVVDYFLKKHKGINCG